MARTTRRYSRTRTYARRPSTRTRTYTRRYATKRYNKRKFKKSLAQNAIYYKVKRVIPCTLAGTNDIFRLGINANGRELPVALTSHNTALWTLEGSANPAHWSMGDLPDLQNQYDSNRLTGVSIKWLPGVPNGAATTTYAPMALVYDRDGIEGDIKTTTLSQLMEQTNGVKVTNMYRPFKKYIKFPKYRINTRIPSHNEIDPSGTTLGTTHYQPNENLAGQWKRVDTGLTNTWFLDSLGNFQYVERGSHIVLHVERPRQLQNDPDVGNALLGSVVLTSYYVYKDRR